MQIVDRRLNPKSKSLGNRQRFLRRAKAEIREAIKDSLKTRRVSEAEGSEKVYEQRAMYPMPAQAAPVAAGSSRFEVELSPVPEVSTVRPERPIAPGSDPTEMTLRRLEFLRSQKLITEQEYQERLHTAKQTY